MVQEQGVQIIYKVTNHNGQSMNIGDLDLNCNGNLGLQIIMKHQAIYNLYTSVKSIRQDGETFIAYDINGNEVSIDMNDLDTKASELKKTIETLNLKIEKIKS